MIYTAKIKATFSFVIEAYSEEEALKLASEKLEASDLYQEGQEVDFGNLWLYSTEEKDAFWVEENE